MQTTASYLPLLAMALATTGSSKEPGTQATCMQGRGQTRGVQTHERMRWGLGWGLGWGSIAGSLAYRSSTPCNTKPAAMAGMA